MALGITFLHIQHAYTNVEVHPLGVNIEMEKVAQNETVAENTS